MDSRNVEDCNWMKTQGPKKAMIKFSRRKDANKLETEKKKFDMKESNFTGNK